MSKPHTFKMTSNPNLLKTHIIAHRQLVQLGINYRPPSYFRYLRSKNSFISAHLALCSTLPLLASSLHCVVAQIRPSLSPAAFRLGREWCRAQKNVRRFIICLPPYNFRSSPIDTTVPRRSSPLRLVGARCVILHLRTWIQEEVSNKAISAYSSGTAVFTTFLSSHHRSGVVMGSYPFPSILGSAEEHPWPPRVLTTTLKPTST